VREIGFHLTPEESLWECIPQAKVKISFIRGHALQSGCLLWSCQLQIRTLVVTFFRIIVNFRTKHSHHSFSIWIRTPNFKWRVTRKDVRTACGTLNIVVLILVASVWRVGVTLRHAIWIIVCSLWTILRFRILQRFVDETHLWPLTTKCLSWNDTRTGKIEWLIFLQPCFFYQKCQHLAGRTARKSRIINFHKGSVQFRFCGKADAENLQNDSQRGPQHSHALRIAVKSSER